jgi:hypothetical protein
MPAAPAASTSAVTIQTERLRRSTSRDTAPHRPLSSAFVRGRSGVGATGQNATRPNASRSAGSSVRPARIDVAMPMAATGPSC